MTFLGVLSDLFRAENVTSIWGINPGHFEEAGRWWQLKYVLFLPPILGKVSDLTSIFLKWDETTNKKYVCLVLSL